VLTKIDKPPVPPPTNFTETATTGGVGVSIPAATPAPPNHRSTLAGPGLSDGPLVNIIKVQPRYPAAAQTRGIEGTVLVQFDVTPSGAVENVVVIESSNSIFNKAAIEATYRFKYRPKVVDGTSYGTRGLQQQFRFNMDD
jgi:protein TonB